MVLVFLHILTNLSACVCVFLHASFGVGVLLNKTKKNLSTNTHTYTHFTSTKQKTSKKVKWTFFCCLFCFVCTCAFFCGTACGVPPPFFANHLCVFNSRILCIDAQNRVVSPTTQQKQTCISATV